MDKDLCGTLDHLLSGDKFPSLSSVLLHKTIPTELFPELHKTGRICVLPADEGFWIDAPVKKRDDGELSSESINERSAQDESGRGVEGITGTDAEVDDKTRHDYTDDQPSPS